jgi:hypothetical protein
VFEQEPYRERTGNARIGCLAVEMGGASYLFPWSREPGRPFLKSAKCRFESDWGHQNVCLTRW